MKKVLINNGRVFVIDDEKNIVKAIERDYERIDRLNLIDEDNDNVYFQDGDNVKQLDLKKDDIVITFYDSDYPNKTVVVKSPEWAENIRAARAAEQKRKEEWARKKADLESNTACDAGEAPTIKCTAE